MSDVNITEVFCEVLSGAVVLLVGGLAAHVSGVMPFETAWTAVTADASFGDLAALLVLCYLSGLVMDAVGLAAGEAFLDNLVNSSGPTAAELKQFLETVPEHMLKYRDTQWAYYSTYRNLLILLVPGGLLAAILAWEKSGVRATAAVIVTAAVLGVVLWRSMIALLGIYFRLSKVKYAQQ